MRTREGWWWPFTLGIYAAVTLYLAWPAPLELTSEVIGQGGDPWQTMWRFEEHAAEAGNLAFWREFFGGGEARLVNYSTLPWLPLHVALGQPLAYNVIWLLCSLLSGYAMYLLIRYLLYSANLEVKQWQMEFAALLGGLYYLLLPYRLAHALGHFGALQLQWLPLSILLLLRFTRRPTVWNSLGLAVVAAIQAWTEHHYALWLALFLILYAGFHRAPLAELLRRHRGYVALAAGAFVLLAVVPYSPTIRLAAQEGSPLNLGPAQAIRFSADLVSFITPASGHPLWGAMAHELGGQHFTGNAAEATQYVGVAALLLIIFFRPTVPRRQYYFWLGSALLFLVVSLGPRLHVLGHVFPLPLPFALVDSWPIFSSVRTVGRAGVMVGLAVAVLLGWVIATQVRRPLAGAVLAGLLVLDFLPGAMPRQAFGLSPAYQVVAEWRGTRLVELPAATNYTASSRALYASRRHGKEVLGTIALERADSEAVLEEIRSIPALRHVLYLRTGQLRLDRPDFFDQSLPDTLAETLTWFDVGGILIHRDSLSPLQFAALNNFLVDDVGLAAQDFSDVVVYPLPAAITERGDGVFLARDSRWANVGFDEKRGHTFGEIPAEAGLTLYNTRPEAKTARLRLTIAPNSHGNLLFSGDGETRQLTAAAGETVEVTVTLPPRARQTYVFRNQLTEAVIVQDPRLIVD